MDTHHDVGNPGSLDSQRIALAAGDEGTIVWSGIAWIAVGIAYYARWPWLFGKRPDGSMALLPRILLFPYLAANWGMWHIRRLRSTEHPSDEVFDGVWVGRRCSMPKLPPNALVVDMTAEFVVPRGILTGHRYVCVPTLDATAPDHAAFDALVRDLATDDGPLYIHCAIGHGQLRDHRGRRDAPARPRAGPRRRKKLMKRARPKVHLNPPQNKTWWAERVAANSRQPELTSINASNTSP